MAEAVSGSHHQTLKRDRCVCPKASMCAFVIDAYLIVFESLVRRLKVMAHPRHLWCHQGDLGITKASAPLRELPHSLVSSIMHWSLLPLFDRM